MDNNLWIIGCGDIGRRVARLYLKDFSKIALKIHALVSSNQSKRQCEELGLETIAVDLDAKESKKMLLNITKTIKNSSLFYFTPPPRVGREDTRFKYFLNALTSLPKRIVLISTTGVYGDSKGAWIDESFGVNPKADRAHRRLSAEQTLVQWAQDNNREYIILRVPGIYAKDRLPLARLKKGLPVVNSREAAWTNRIHADDLAMVCRAAMESNISGEIYNVTDGQPSTMTEYFNQVADYANLTRPPQISMQEAERTLSAGMVSYLQESRRIRNAKMIKDLRIELNHPNLKEGLKK